LHFHSPSWFVERRKYLEFSRWLLLFGGQTVEDAINCGMIKDNFTVAVCEQLRLQQHSGFIVLRRAGLSPQA
jgi:hypothetical protein